MPKLTIIEGSADEILKITRGLEDVSAQTEQNETMHDDEASSVEHERQKVFVSTKVARRVLNRRPLSNEQKSVLQLLAVSAPDWVPASDIQKKIGYSPQQFAGLMGAFGRRISHTRGFVDDSWFFDAEWNYDLHGYDYRLPDTVLEAVKLEGLL